MALDSRLDDTLLIWQKEKLTLWKMKSLPFPNDMRWSVRWYYFHLANGRKANTWQMALDGRLDDTTCELANEEKLTLGKWH